MRAGSGEPPSSALPRRARRVLGPALGLLAALAGAGGCSNQDMVTQPKLKPLQPSNFFSDGQASRPIEPGTVARSAVGDGATFRVHPAFEFGEVNGLLIGYIPLKGFDPNEAVAPGDAREARHGALERGRERFNIFCAPCHGRTGLGDGMIVQRGFSKPPSLHEARLREAPPGHFYRVITNGYGAMYSYASRIPPADRWAITSYIRALQLSQNAKLADVPEGERSRLQEGPTP